MKNIVLASNNPHKAQEFNAILKNSSLKIIPQSHFHIEDAIESGLTFIENAIIKARHASAKTNMPALADDSGLEVDALAGAPGIYSARFAGTPTDHAQNIKKLLKELKDIPEQSRTARFQCVIVYLKHAADPTPLIFTGTWEGKILFKEQGTNGFGYDPIFYVPTHNCSAAELAPNIKNTISHRGQALAKLKQHSFFRSPGCLCSPGKIYSN